MTDVMVEDWAAPTPISENRSGLIGKAVDRYEGPLKVAGQAAYAYETETPSPPAYAVVIASPIALGRITAVDTAAAQAAPGVRLVWTHLNIPEQGHDSEGKHGFMRTHNPAFVSDRIAYFGQPIGLVAADSFEAACGAADLVKFSFEAEAPKADFHAAYDEGVAPASQPDVRRGDFDAAFEAAAVQLDDVWRTPMQNHCQMEPHATVAWWEGERCIVHSSVQMVPRAQTVVANTLQTPPENVQLFSRYIGGGFGGKGIDWDLTLAPLAARALGQPVKLAFSRQFMFHGTVHRPATRLRVRLGATADGRLTAMSQVAWSHCEVGGDFMEPAASFVRGLYAAANRYTAHRHVQLDLPPPGAMRAPGEASGTLALECAMDEMAEKLGLDPIAFRILNEPQVDPDNGRPFSIRQLVRCMQEGAQRFGWDRRDPTPGHVREGRWSIGLGMAAAVRGHMFIPNKAGVGVDKDGVVTLRQTMTDLGTGSFTILAQIVGETLGVPLEQVRVDIGRSDAPPAMGSGGQFGAASAGSAALAAGMNLRKALAELAAADPASPLYGGPAEQAAFQDGLIVIGNRSESLASLVARSAPQGVYAEGGSGPAKNSRNWSQHTYGAHFVEVGVDTVTGEVRMRRMLGVFAAGRILNAKLARSQLTGGMIWGVGSALTEGNSVDPRYGSFINQDLASYLVPTQADIGELDAIMLEEVDDKAGPLGIKGVGELGISGAGAAIANAVYNACGVRIRDYPITPDKVIAELILQSR
jgi:xanthine dehydrogenase YagR molybdenum-binding subunit